MVIRLLQFVLGLAWAAAFVALAHETGGHAGHGQSGQGSARGALGAAAAFDAQGNLWAVYAADRRVLVRRSADAGRSWEKPLIVNPQPEGIGTDGDSFPKIATGAAGEIYVTWTKPLAKPYTGDIRFSRSVDGGKSFSNPVTLHRDRQEITHRFDALTVTRDGRVYVAWIDKRDQVVAAKGRQAYRGAAVYYAVSDDKGATFRGDFKLADHSCECCRIALLPQGDGSVLALWRHVFEPNIRDHALAQMNIDGTPGSLRRATFDNWRIDACPHHGPSLAADAAGRLHAVWFSQGVNGSGVFYGRLSDGGVEGQRRIGGETAEHADLLAVGNRLVLAWKEFDGERSRLRAMVSGDAGARWREFELATTTGASAQPRLLAHNNQFYVFWNTQREPLSLHKVPQ